MHFTLILLAAASQVIAATDAPYATPLATITTLSDGHLPTCFTGHPTHPCPTNGPEGKRDLMGDLAGNPVGGLAGDVNEAARIVPMEQIDLTASGKPALPTDAPKVRDARDAMPEATNGDYIPHSSEWAIPGDFKFTDSIANKDYVPHPSEWAMPGSSNEDYVPHPSEWAMPGSSNEDYVPHPSEWAMPGSSNEDYVPHPSEWAMPGSSNEDYVPHPSEWAMPGSSNEDYVPHPSEWAMRGSSNEDYVPHPSEWAVPGSFKFIDSIAMKDYIPHPNEWAMPGGSNKDYVPHPSEWAIPGNFKFTDSIDHDATNTTESAVRLTTSCSEGSNVAPTTVVPQSNGHVDHYNKHYIHQHNNVHHNKHQDDHMGRQDTYAHASAISKPAPANSYSQTTQAPTLPSVSKEQHAVANSSSEVHIAASIGSLLNGAMYPGTMRKPPYAAAVASSKVENKTDAYSTTHIQNASISTPCTSSETSSSYSAGPAYNVKPVTLVTSPRPASSSQAQPTASYKAAEPVQLQQTARHFVS